MKRKEIEKQEKKHIFSPKKLDVTEKSRKKQIETVLSV